MRQRTYTKHVLFAGIIGDHAKDQTIATMHVARNVN